MRSGRQKVKVRFMREVEISRNDFNEPVMQWVTVVTAFAEKRDVSDIEKVAAGEEAGALRSRFVVPFSPKTIGLTSADEILSGGRTWNIKGVKEVAQAGRRREVEVTAVADSQISVESAAQAAAAAADILAAQAAAAAAAGGGVDTNLWTPAQIATALWIDALDADTITHSGGQVSQVDDKSGNGRHLVQTVGAEQPIYEEASSVSGGMPAIVHGRYTRFEGIGAFDKAEIHCVMSYGNGVVASFEFWSTILSTTDGSGGAPWIMGRVGKATFYTTNAITGIHYKHGGDVGSGVPLELPKALVRFEFATHSGETSLFSSEVYADRGWEGAVNEFIILPAASDLMTRQKIEGYLAHKWSLSHTLDTSHPYKATSPKVV